MIGGERIDAFDGGSRVINREVDGCSADYMATHIRMKVVDRKQ